VVKADAFGKPAGAAVRRLIEYSTTRWTGQTDPFVSRQMMSPAAGERKGKTNDSMLNGHLPNVNERTGRLAQFLGNGMDNPRLRRN
jgi:hypothetical protein